MDTAVVLQIRAGLELIEADLAATRGHLADLARRHRDTPMAGRTHLQHALPITFGYKAAIWLSALRPPCRAPWRNFARACCSPNSAAPPARSPRSARAANRAQPRRTRSRTRPRRPAITWHVARDGIAETVQFLALLAGSLGKIAFDVMLMSADRVRRGGRTVCRRPRLQLDDAAKAQPDLVRD